MLPLFSVLLGGSAGAKQKLHWGVPSGIWADPSVTGDPLVRIDVACPVPLFQPARGTRLAEKKMRRVDADDSQDPGSALIICLHMVITPSQRRAAGIA